MDPAHPLVTTLADSVSQVTRRRPVVVGAPYACDLFALQQVFNMPAVVFGPRGGNAHAADEYLELSTVFEFWECLLAFVVNWCG
jgi:acetylornithine deacetylase